MNTIRTLIRYGLGFTLAACIAGIVLLVALAAFCELLLRQERSATRRVLGRTLGRLPR